MREVPLSRGMVALVDDEDFERVSQHKWDSLPAPHTTYAKTRVKKSDGRPTTLYLHRFILNLPPGRQPEVDHISGEGLDCRKENMRITTRSQNAQNRRGARRNSQSGVRGVFLDKRRGTYRADVVVMGRHISLGSHPTLAAAEQAAIAGRQRYMTHAPENKQPATA